MIEIQSRVSRAKLVVLKTAAYSNSTTSSVLKGRQSTNYLFHSRAVSLSYIIDFIRTLTNFLDEVGRCRIKLPNPFVSTVMAT